MDSHQLTVFTAIQDADGFVTGYQTHFGNGQVNLLADHLAQAGGGSTDADIDELCQCVEFELIEYLDRSRHLAESRTAAESRNSLSCCSVTGLLRKAAPTSLARLTISS